MPLQHRHGYAAGLHHGLPTAGAKRLRSRPTPRSCRSCAAHRPISTRLEPASLLRGVKYWFTSVAPSGLASTSPHRLAVPARRRLRQGRLPPSPPLRRSGCPQASTRLLRQPGGKVSHPPRSISAAWRTAPRRKTPRTSGSGSPGATHDSPARERRGVPPIDERWRAAHPTTARFTAPQPARHRYCGRHGSRRSRRCHHRPGRQGTDTETDAAAGDDPDHGPWRWALRACGGYMRRCG
jgi:hypothetical protein